VAQPPFREEEMSPSHSPCMPSHLQMA
jgi:hypothetical protein